MNRPFRFGLALLVAGMAGCASTPAVHYHTLLAPSDETAAGAPASFLIDVLPVGLPEQLDQAPLVVRQGRSGIAVLDSERWAGPLSDELRGALSSQLSHRLATQDINGLPAPADTRVLRVKLQVRRFDAWPGQRVQLDADWSLGFSDAAGKARLLCRGRFDEPAPGGNAELVQAQQRLVASLAARIAADASLPTGAIAAECSALTSTAAGLPKAD